ncbi:MAG: type II secretion system F family protein [Candidatus Omnitrophota bacterium]|jgi:type IV pilus assembly protein PilC
MPTFTYIARDNKGMKVAGSEEASSQDELINRLQLRNLIVVNIASGTKEDIISKTIQAPGKKHKYKRYGIKEEDLVVFCRQLSTLLSAGVTILKSLDIISKQVYSRKFYNVLNDMQKHLEAGLTFHEAMAKYPKVFSDVWVNLVESGEASGNLAVVLSRLASYLEKRASFKRKIISSLIYPLILMCVAVGALLFLTIKIIPTFAQLFSGFNLKLPVFTEMLIKFSKFIREGFLGIIGAIVGVFFLLKKYISTRGGRKNYEQLQFNMPVFGEFFRAMVVERFSSEMSTLIESGVPLLYSLEITEHSVSNSVMAGIIHKIKDDVREGRPLNNSLDKSGFFEPMVVQMVAIGEEIGELAQMFKRINAFYEERTETFLVRFTSLFEPFMLIFMGLVIGLMVVGMFLPIFQIASISGM